MSPSVFAKHFKNAIYFKWFLRLLYFSVWIFFLIRKFYNLCIYGLNHLFRKSRSNLFVSYLPHGRYSLEFFQFEYECSVSANKTLEVLASVQASPLESQTDQPQGREMEPPRIVQVFELVISRMVKKFWNSGALFVLETLRLFRQLSGKPWKLRLTMKVLTKP